MTTRLSLKDTDGQLRPLLEIAIGTPPQADGARIVLQVPIDVALRAPLVVSIDAAGDTVPKPQTELVTASYVTCTPLGCVADAGLTPEVVAALQTATTTNVTFTTLAGSKKITVPVTMTGFGDAWAALGQPTP